MKNYDTFYAKGIEYTQEAIHNWNERRTHLIEYYSDNQIFNDSSYYKARVLTAILWLDMRISNCITSLGSKSNNRSIYN